MNKKILVYFLIISFIISCKSSKDQIDKYIPAIDNLIPKPVSIIKTGKTFSLNKKSKICINPGSEEILKIAQYLSDKLKIKTSLNLQIKETRKTYKRRNIYFLILENDTSFTREAYELEITKRKIFIKATNPEGLFRGIQTLIQIISNSDKIEKSKNIKWQIPTCIINDYPRFEWRGAMLDVARHFFKVEDVKKYIDRLAFYKINRFHLHLTDDQGWRIEIKSWPKLTEIGASTQVGGGKGGYFTQDEFKDIINYAKERYIIVIPEIDIPGHTNAALASYNELNCDNTSPKLYKGTRVGFSSLCIEKEITYHFINDVIGEIAALLPDPYIHIGGDEANSTHSSDYIIFIEKVQEIIKKYDKILIGWEEIAQAELDNTSIVQHWNSNMAIKAAKKSIKIIMSPSSKAYLDMKYDSTTSLGLDWAGYTDIKDAYSWDPAEWLEGIKEKDITGIEAPLWSETIQTIEDIEYLAFPRIIGYAEIGWSLKNNRNWKDYKTRLIYHKKLLLEMDINFYDFK